MDHISKSIITWLKLCYLWGYSNSWVGDPEPWSWQVGVLEWEQADDEVEALLVLPVGTAPGQREGDGPLLVHQVRRRRHVAQLHLPDLLLGEFHRLPNKKQHSPR